MVFERGFHAERSNRKSSLIRIRGELRFEEPQYSGAPPRILGIARCIWFKLATLVGLSS